MLKVQLYTLLHMRTVIDHRRQTIATRTQFRPGTPWRRRRASQPLCMAAMTRIPAVAACFGIPTVLARVFGARVVEVRTRFLFMVLSDMPAHGVAIPHC